MLRSFAFRSTILFLLTLCAAAGAQAGSSGVAADENAAAVRFDNPSCSPDGSRIAVTDEQHNAVLVYDTITRSTVEIANLPSSGYAYNWSADGTKLGFKQLLPAKAGSPQQVPAVYDATTQQVTPLHAVVPRAGVPSFSADGQIVFTIGEDLYIADATGRVVQRFHLGNYANLAPISPDGRKVAYNSKDDQICVIDLSTGETRQLTRDENGYFGPVWSPDSSRLVASAISGRLVGIDVASGQVYALDTGTTPSWAPDSATVFYNKLERVDGIGVIRADVCHIRYDGTQAARLARDPAQPPAASRIAANGQKLVFVSLTDGGLYEAQLTAEKADVAIHSAPAEYSLGTATRLPCSPATVAQAKSDVSQQMVTAAPLVEINPANVVVSHSMPYIHQVYDTPDDFNGNWACNATAAMMAIGYYQKLAYWDCTCSTPYSHVSHYGRYISQIYSFNGHTYNIGSADASGRIAYGGYGYIVRNDWADTKGYMADYFNNHGISSSVDWSPSWAKLQTEINAEHPFVVLTSLTSAGHYITAKGYMDSQHTAIFNDPYGNKNSGYMNYSGAGVYYDWPGYNNGYSNLNTVHCFIYARASFPSTWAASYHAQSFPSSMTAGSTAVAWAEFTNDGSGVWQHCETKLGTSSPHDRSSPFCTISNWKCADGSNASCTRPTDVDQSSVAQGAVGRFTFVLTAPSTPGTYVEKFQLVREGVTWFGPEISWTITVTASQGTLTGTVRNAANSQAISGAGVTLSGVGSTTTNSSGVYTFSNVNAGSYTVSVTATGFNGASAPVTITASQTTTKDFALTPSDTQPPSVPTGLTASATGATTVQLSWTASTDNVGVAGYDIRRNGTVIGSATGTSYTDSGATPASTFTYDVRAKDAVPNYSNWSSSASATTPPSPPQNTPVFSDGFNGNLSNWMQQQTQVFTYSTTRNHAGYTGAGSAYVAAGQMCQMYREFDRPFAQAKVSGYFYDTYGGYKQGACGNSYRQAIGLRAAGGASMFIDNEIWNSPDYGKYYYRLYDGTPATNVHTGYATRNTNVNCTTPVAAWVHFETTVTPTAPGASPAASCLLKVTDPAGSTTSTQNAPSNFAGYGMSRITVGMSTTTAGEGYWDDISIEAYPPDWPVMGTPSGISETAITWNFSPRDNNHFGFEVADAAGAVKSPLYPASGWISRGSTSWTETGLAANTQYTRKVRGWNGTLFGAWSLTASPWTLSVPPSAGSITADETSMCLNSPITWTAVGGFGAGAVQYYKYAWDQNASHTFTSSEPNWASGTITTQASSPGIWYLHVQGYNGANVANGSFHYPVTAGAGITITQQPASQIVCPNAAAEFSVVASGEGTLTYQWQVDGVNLSNGGNISGADTPTLQIADAGNDDTGSYTCVISGACGAVTSNPAALSLKAETTITQQPQPQVVCQGSPASLTVAASGEGTLTYQWQKDGQDVTGETSATLSLTATPVEAGGSYRCVVTGTCGSIVSDTALLVVTTYPGDFNGDCVVNDNDFPAFAACTTGADVHYAEHFPQDCHMNIGLDGTLPADFDKDGDVDLDDFGGFQVQLGTP